MLTLCNSTIVRLFAARPMRFVTERAPCVARWLDVKVYRRRSRTPNTPGAVLSLGRICRVTALTDVVYSRHAVERVPLPDDLSHNRRMLGAKDILAAALKLNTRERAPLVDELSASVNTVPGEVNAAQGWAASSSIRHETRCG
jgi:hypothetical protein